MIKKATLLTAFSVTAFSAWAQDTSPDTLVVTANRFQQPRSAVLAPVTIVTRQDIERWQSTSVMMFCAVCLASILRRAAAPDKLLHFHSRHQLQPCTGID